MAIRTMSKKLTYGKESERGEVMLEGMIVVIMTTFMLLWILAIGFVYYQKYLVTIITNDTAEKIAAYYNNSEESDIVIGYISVDMLLDRKLYRAGQNDTQKEINQRKVENYVKYMLSKYNFANVIENYDEDIIVTLNYYKDSFFRSHVEVVVECRLNTPFGFALEYEGMNGKITYRTSARADCTDIIDYYSLSQTVANTGSNITDKSKVLSFLNALKDVFE